MTEPSPGEDKPSQGEDKRSSGKDTPTVTLGRFFEQAREGTLTGIRCGACGALAVPPKALCPECGARRWEAVPLSGEGTIASYTIIRVAPRAHADD
ncbi:MAG: hypothetical protein DMD84_29565, partial [Candidatus Rokuibacteriota bacterium]